MNSSNICTDKLFTNNWNAVVGFFGFNEPIADDSRRHFWIVESVDEFLIIQNVTFHVEQKLQNLVLDVVKLSFVGVYTEIIDIFQYTSVNFILLNHQLTLK